MPAADLTAQLEMLTQRLKSHKKPTITVKKRLLETLTELELYSIQTS
jgi:hypothetical protein